MTKKGATEVKARAEAANGAVDDDADLKGLLLAADDFDGEDIHLEGIGTVTVRGLNRAEAIQVAEIKGVQKREAQMMTMGLVRPLITYQEAELMIKVKSAGVIQVITDTIHRLSGLDEGARKEAMSTFPSEPES